MRIDQRNEEIDAIVLGLFYYSDTLLNVNEIFSSISIPSESSLLYISIFDVQSSLNRLLKKEALEYSVINNQYHSTDREKIYAFGEEFSLEESLKNKKSAFSKKDFFKKYCKDHKVIYSDKFMNKVFYDWINKGLIKETEKGKYEKV